MGSREAELHALFNPSFSRAPGKARKELGFTSSFPQHESLELVSQTPSIPKAEQVTARSLMRGSCPHVAPSHREHQPVDSASGNMHVDRAWSTADICYLVCLGVHRKQNCYCRISAVGYSTCKQTFWLIFLRAP